MKKRHLSSSTRLIRTAAHLALLACLALASPESKAQTAASGPIPRLNPASADSHLVRLEGTLHPLAQTKFDVGPVEPTKRLQSMTMVFNRSATQKADLNALNAAQENPSSPLYHKWLTPEQFAARFGMASADLDQASSWLEHEGFTVDRIARSRDRIFFSGLVSQVNHAFSTELHYYTVKGEKHFAPSTALSIPASLAEVVLTIGNLDNFRPHPMHRFVPSANPNFTSGTTGNHFLSPADIATIYDINPAYQSGLDGTGQSITILGQSFVLLSDIENFQTSAGLKTVKDPKLVLVPGTGPDGITSADNEAESDLDLEWSSSIAPGADVFFVYTGDGDAGGVFDSLQYAVDNRISPIISLSYGACESLIGSASNVQSIEDIAQQGITQGQTLIASSGDDGASGCFYDTKVALSQRTVLSTGYPASSSFFTAVGGTQFNEGSSSYWASTPGTDIISSALSYIPEVAWNEDEVVNGIGYLGSTGGGASIFFPKPSWQTGVSGIPADNARDVPDVALDSAGGHDGLLFCSSDGSFWALGQQASCNSGFRDSSTGDVTEAGGTSFAAPIFAGMIALVNQQQNSTGQGLINPQLYALAASPSIYASAFHDITAGDNKCDTGEATACPNGPTGYAAGPAYDQATGLGTIDLNHLLAAWGTSPLAPSKITVVPSATTVSQGATVQFAISVTSVSGTGTPSGTVALLLDGTAITPDVTLAAGAATFTTTLVGNGTHVLVSTYSGDTLFGPSTSTVTLDALTGTSIEISVSNPKPLVGSAETFNISVQPSAGLTHPDGSVTLQLDGVTVASNVTLSALSEASYTAALNTLGTHTLSVAYSGSADFSTSTGTFNINVVAPIVATSTSITPATATPVIGAPDAFAISVKPASGAALPSGTVTVTVDGTASPSTLTNGVASFTTSFATAGSHTVQVSYAGNTSFSASAASTTITVPQQTISLTASSVTLTSGASGTSTVTVTPSNGYTGTVAFTVSSANPAIANACISSLANAVVGTASAASSTLTISTGQSTCPAGSQTASVVHPNLPGERHTIEAASAFAGLLMLGLLGRRSRKLRLFALLLAASVLGPILTGCGSSGTSIPKTPTTPGTYTLTITAHDTVSTTITASTTLTLVVN